MPNGNKNVQKDQVAKKGELKIRNLEKTYWIPGCPNCTALQDLNLTVQRESLTVLVGPSGCGKSTLANIAAGYDQPTKGQVLLDDKQANKPDQERIMVFQETSLWPWMTVMKNVTFGPSMLGGTKMAQTREKALNLLEKVGLSEFKDKYPAQLSGGMQRRAELCRALIMDPKVMILDEPFRGLDVMTRELMQEHLLKLWEESRQTMFFITSEIDEALFLADRVLVMTSLPGTIKQEVEVDLPRPRDLNLVASKRYAEIKAEVMNTLFDEVSKMFGGLQDKSQLMGLCSTGT